jgi:hypothetical protein
MIPTMVGQTPGKNYEARSPELGYVLVMNC